MALAFALVALAALFTPLQAFCDAVPSLGVVSLLVGLLFAWVALWGRMCILWRADISDRKTLTAANRAASGHANLPVGGHGFPC